MGQLIVGPMCRVLFAGENVNVTALTSMWRTPGCGTCPTQHLRRSASLSRATLVRTRRPAGRLGGRRRPPTGADLRVRLPRRHGQARSRPTADLSRHRPGRCDHSRPRPVPLVLRRLAGHSRDTATVPGRDGVLERRFIGSDAEPAQPNLERYRQMRDEHGAREQVQCSAKRVGWSRSGCRGGEDCLGRQPEIPDHRIRVALAADQDDLAGGSTLDRDGDEVGTQ